MKMIHFMIILRVENTKDNQLDELSPILIRKGGHSRAQDLIVSRKLLILITSTKNSLNFSPEMKQFQMKLTFC